MLPMDNTLAASVRALSDEDKMFYNLRCRWPFSSRREEEEKKESLTVASTTPSPTPTIITTATTTVVTATTTTANDLTPTPEPPVSTETPKTPAAAEEPAPKLVTRYSVGTQTTFLEENPLNLERDDNEPEPNRVTGKEKFRKTLRLSTDAIVSIFFS